MPAIQETDGCAEPVSVCRKDETLEESLNHRIAAARKHVEELCVLKAKAEALGILQYPRDFIESVAYF